MKKVMALAAALGATILGGCATYPDGYYYSPYYGVYDLGYYDYDGGGGGRHHGRGGGRSEPGNEAGMFPGRPGDGRGGPSGGASGGGGSRGGEAGSR